MPRVPPKRNRAAGSNATGAAELTTNEHGLTFLATVVFEWKSIAGDKARAHELITALVSHQSLIPGIPDHADTYWLVLANHTINRLVQHMETHSSSVSPGKLKQLQLQQQQQLGPVAVVLAHLCYSVATVMMLDKSKLERITLKHVRSLVGRVMVSLTVGCLTAMPYITGKTLWTCVLALEMVIFQQAIKTTPTFDGWHLAIQAVNSYVEDQDDVALECEASAKLVSFSEDERVCLAAVMNVPLPSPPKRSRRSASSVTPPIPTTDEDTESFPLQMAFKKFDQPVLEGRVIIRRLPSIVLLWLVNGQERILRFCLDVLRKGVDEISRQNLGTPLKKKSKSKRATMISIPGEVATIKLVSRLFVIVAEAVTNGGSRPPVGGLDVYVQASLTQKNVSKPADVRDLMVVTMHSLLQAHASCLTVAKPHALINDDETTAISNSTGAGLARFCPVVHKSLEALCRADGTSSRKLLAIAASIVFQTNVLDAKLCSFAVGQFHSCLSFLLDGRETSSTDLIDSFKILQPLPIPSVQESSKRNAKKDNECTFAGFLEKPCHPVTDQVLLPFFFRALGSPRAVFSFLFDIMEACYDSVSYTDATGEMIGQVGTPKLSKEARSKRSPPLHQGKPMIVRLNAIRAGLASDACKVFRCLIVTQQPLQAYFRSCLSVDQLRRFVRLTGLFETILTTASFDAKSRDSSASFFLPPSTDFNLHERTLWSAHTNLCYVLGRGTLLYTSAKKDQVTPILGDTSTRLAVFREVPKACGTKGWPLHLPASLHALITTNLTSEPCLPGQHEPEEFIVSSLIGSITTALEDPSLVTYAKYFCTDHDEKTKTTDEKAPLSFRDARLLLVAISRLPSKDQIKHVSRLAKELKSSLALYEIDDALGSIVVENGEVSQFVARVVIVFTTLLNLLSADLGDALAEEVGHYQYALPPLYKLSSILDGVFCKDGNWYKKDCCFMGLFSDWESPSVPVASVTSTLPNDFLDNAEDILHRALLLGFHSARKDYGQLLFAAWNALGRKLTWDTRGLQDLSIKPFMEKNPSSMLLVELREDICKIFLRVHKFKSAILPKSLLGQTLKNVSIDQAFSLSESLHDMLMKACAAVRHLLKHADRDFDDIELTLFEALPVYIAFIMAMHTTSSHSFSSRVSGKKKEKGTFKRRKLTTSSSACYDIELLASIMSDDDSAGSEDEFDFPETSDEIRFDGLSQFHEACNLFGAAPVHPDWLDNSTIFNNGIENLMAGQNAMSAIECLTKLGTIANEQHSRAIKKRMAVLVGKDSLNSECAWASRLCCLAMDNSNAMLPPDSLCSMDTVFQEAVGSIFAIPHEAIHDFFNDSVSNGWRAAKEAWLSNCPQRLSGVIHSQSMDGLEASSGEYRAGGDWEILLSESLVGACSGCGMYDSDISVWKSFDVASSESLILKPRILKAFVLEERWLRICQCVVSQLMPAAALFRFALAGGNGRNPHQLNTRAQPIDLARITSSEKELSQFSRPLFSWSETLVGCLSECISLLVRRSARSNAESFAKRSCIAVASNLLVEAHIWEDFDGIESISLVFDTIDAMQTVVDPTVLGFDDSRSSSAEYLIKALIKVLQKKGKSSTLKKSMGKESVFPSVYACLCSGTLFEASVLEIARYEKANLFCDEGSLRESAIKGLFWILSTEDEFAQAECRATVAEMLVELLELDLRNEDNQEIRSTVMKVLMSIEMRQLDKLIGLAFPEDKEKSDNPDHASRAALGVAKVLTLALSGDEGGVFLDFSRKVFTCLQRRLETVEAPYEARESSLGLLFFYACHVGTLDQVGTSLLDRLRVNSLFEPSLTSFECLLTFVTGLRTGQQESTVTYALSESQPKGRRAKDRSGKRSSPDDSSNVKQACSHALREGFFHQHWYNCYTCGLVFDKGCCTLCALVCHKGHEVAYSRSSSFFCDCGAEVESAGEQNRVVCKCISALSDEEAEQIWREERAKSYLTPISESTLSETGSSKECSGVNYRPIDLFINRALSFGTKGSMIVEKLVAAAIRDSWLLTIFSLINHQSPVEEFSAWALGDEDGASSDAMSRESIVASFSRRSGIPLELNRLEHQEFALVRVARPGSFNVKLSLDSSIDRVKRAALTRRGITRSVAVVDSRGRLIIGEPSCLVFCTILPLVNTRYIDDAINTQIGRAQISVIATHSLSFNVVGIQICREKECYVVVWGTSEVCVVVLKKDGFGVEKTVNLDVDLDPHDSDSYCIIRCDWVPGSQTLVSVAFGTFVKIFKIADSQSNEVMVPQLVYNVAYEAVVKDIAWVLLPMPQKAKKSEPPKLVLFLLMDNGRLHEARLQINSRGEAEALGGQSLDRSSRCVDIPTAGVRPYEGATAGKVGSSTRSMGEGCSLSFLPLSNILLYKCVSSCVVALLLDDSGEIKGSFELLPDRLDSEVLSDVAEPYSITGPYTHWKEVDLSDGGTRLVCVGKSARANQAKLLSVIVREKSVKVKEITCTIGGSAGLSISLSSSFEGLALFSGPSLPPNSKFNERIYFCVVTSNGSVLIYGDVNDQTDTDDSCAGMFVNGGQSQKEKQTTTLPDIALTIYEDLHNVSDIEELRFIGDGVCRNADSMKEKLSSRNGVYLLSPARDGCAVSVSLGGPVDLSKLVERDASVGIPNLEKSEDSKEDLVIVALRFLVGSTATDCIPHRVSVQGRPVEFTPNIKRWYDVPLTLEEILMVLRSKTVSIAVGPTFESGKNPAIDAIEVYAVEKTRVFHLIPRSLEPSQIGGCSLKEVSSSDSNCNQVRALVRKTRILSLLFPLVGGLVAPGTPEEMSLKHLIRSTAIIDDKLLRDNIIDILAHVEKNPDVRQSFVDECTIIGIASAFQHICQTFRRRIKASEFKQKHPQRRLRTILDVGLKSAIAIAISRPCNYVRAIGMLSTEGLSPTSIGVDAVSILEHLSEAGFTFQDMLETVVHLVLSELSIDASRKESAAATFATFSIITKIFNMEDQAVVEQCCQAVRSFVQTHSSSTSSHGFDVVDSNHADVSGPIAYQCDSCSKFPITDARYTLLEDDHDIDLCTKCYQLGKVFAESVENSPDSAVIINERPIGGSVKLSCGQIKQMESVPIANGFAIAEQVEQALQQAKRAGHRSSESKHFAKRAMHCTKSLIPSDFVIDFDKFTNQLFDNLIDLVLTELSGAGFSTERFNPVLGLVLDSICMGSNHNAHIARGKKFVRDFLKQIRRLIDGVLGGLRSDRTQYLLLNTFLRSLARLTGFHSDESTASNIDTSEAAGPVCDKQKRKTDPRFTCDVHNVPAVRRRCSTGGNKRFYVCGMDRKQRCKYFKWAEEGKSETTGHVEKRSRFEEELEQFIWYSLNDKSPTQASTLSEQLCDLLELELSSAELGKGTDIRRSEADCSISHLNYLKKGDCHSLDDGDTALSDFQDGVYCSKEKLWRVRPPWICTQDYLSLRKEILPSDDNAEDQKYSEKFIEASLDLMSIVASAPSSGEFQIPGNKRWFSLLCDVISASPASQFRPQAKKALKRLCGGKHARYHCVADYYVFGFQFKEILYYAKSALDGALSVREMARQCGENWNQEEITWSTLNAGGLLGTLDLVPEHCLTSSNSKRMRTILNELLSVTKSRNGNWRNFCSLLSLPLHYRRHTDLPVLGQERLEIEQAFGGPPILSCFWLCCSISGPNQLKIMRLIDQALTSVHERNNQACVGSGEELRELADGVQSDSLEMDKDDVSFPFTLSPRLNPEDVLLNGEKALSVEDLFAFAIQFVLRGRTADFRRIARQVICKLSQHLDKRSLEEFLNLLVGKPLYEIEKVGCTSIQYLQLVDSIVKVALWKGSQDLSHVGRSICKGLAQQMNALCEIGGKVEIPVESGRVIATKRFDLTNCVHCHRYNHPSQKNVLVKTTPSLSDKKLPKHRCKITRKGTPDVCKGQGAQWHHDQLRPFARVRMESTTENTCSSEFAVYVQLKSRLAISEFHVTINDPRGRYARTIDVSFTPRHVTDVNELKSNNYDQFWQNCATLNLTRGATQASCVLPATVIAANLKFEYCDFYDRSGGSRPPDGSSILVCPRCSRPVNNAHGVCGSCGECLFQCRRCRHIQYDRPDAFFCTECGHCSSGSFSYELNAGVASNAVAIVDDESFGRMMKLTQIAIKLHGDLQTALMQLVRTASKTRTATDIEHLAEYSSAMKRALLGDLPQLVSGEKKGDLSLNESSMLTSVRDGDGRSTSNVANRARSLLRLARQLRNEGERGGRSRELLLREAFLAGSAFALETANDDSPDIVGLVSNGDRRYTLTRLVASVTGRRDAGGIPETTITDSSTVTAGTTNASGTSAKKVVNKGPMHDCDKLYQLMREAEFECYELQRRLDAWSRLEQDCLKEIFFDSEVPFSPTRCSRCAGPVTLHLLVPLVRLVRSDKISEIECFVTDDLIRALFLQPPSIVKDLDALKRRAITTLCLKSDYAGKLILKELRARLPGSQDQSLDCILGKLLEHDFSLSSQFLALATETLKKS